MPILSERPRCRGISLPPSGWALLVLLSLYIFTGLIGHDPWKHDDAISIGIAFDMATHHHWLVPQLAGQVYADAPLYYWLAAGCIKLFSWLLPAHDAARLASGLCTLLALEFILLAARELHGKEFSAAAPLVLAGSIGFLFHAHEAQPMLAALSAHTAAYWALTLLPRRPRFAAMIFAAATAACFLANGLLPVFTLLPITLCALWQSENRLRDAYHLGLALVLAIALCSAWLLPLHFLAPDFLGNFLSAELAPWKQSVQAGTNILRHLNLLLWYAWPALPLAAWALWSKRRALRSRPLALPLVSFFALLLLLGIGLEIRNTQALLLLPPLVLLAVPGVATLRRGAANAFDWFGMMTFTFLAAISWIVWYAMVFAWPARLARQIVRLEPGFVGQFRLPAVVVSLSLTLVWFWLICTSPRSPMRGIMHWMAGLTLFWLLIALLWMPWIDYGKSYRPLSTALARAIPAQTTCIANANLPNALLASLDYFSGIRSLPLESEAGKRCNALLAIGTIRDPRALSKAGWTHLWEGGRPGDRRSSERIHLFRRDSRRPATDLSEIAIDSGDGTQTRHPGSVAQQPTENR